VVDVVSQGEAGDGGRVVADSDLAQQLDAVVEADGSGDGVDGSGDGVGGRDGCGECFSVPAVSAAGVAVTVVTVVPLDATMATVEALEAV